jgi:hypothetical protein
MLRITLIFMQAMLAALLLFTAAFPAWAGEKSGSSKIPAHTPEWTDNNQSDPGMAEGRQSSRRLRGVPSPESGVDSVAYDLQKIVVLCATKPQSAEFDQAWALYLKKHYKPGMNVDGLINEIQSRAKTYVRFGDGRRGTRLPTSVDQDKTRRRMRRVADKTIAKVR